MERFVPSFFVLRYVYITQNDKASTGTCTHYRASNVYYSATDPSIRVEEAIRCGLDSPVEESEDENGQHQTVMRQHYCQKVAG